jgi:hypothetical protein
MNTISTSPDPAMKLSTISTLSIVLSLADVVALATLDLSTVEALLVGTLMVVSYAIGLRAAFAGARKL